MHSAVIICREITMSAVREWAATLGKKAYRKVNVSSWGKYKTGIQVLVPLPLGLVVVQAAHSRKCSWGAPSHVVLRNNAGCYQ